MPTLFSARVPDRGRTLARFAASALLSLTATAMAGTDIQVTHDANSLAQNETCVALNRGWPGNVVIAYNDVTWPNRGLGVSFSHDSGGTWSSQNLPSVHGYEADPSVASALNGLLYAGYISLISSSGPPFQNNGIYVCTSLDGGLTWLGPTTVDRYLFPGTPSYFCDKSFLAVDTFPASPYRDRLYVAWQRDNANGVNADIFLASSTDSAQTFQYATGAPTGRISDLPSVPAPPLYASSNANCPIPVVGADGTVYVAWQDAPLGIQGPAHIWIDKSTDGGQTFGTDVLAATFDAVARYPKGGRSFMVRSFPQLAYDPLHDALRIVFEHDPDRGSDIRVESDLPPGSHPSQPPDLACQGNFVYVVWADNRHNPAGTDIFFNRSIDGGLTWGAEQRLNADVLPGTASALMPRLAVDGSMVYATWLSRQTGLNDVFVAYSMDNGATWSMPVPLDPGAAPGQYDSSAPEIAADAGNVYVAWSENYGGNQDLIVNWSNSAGASWQATPARLDHAPAGNAVGVKLAAQGMTVCAAWMDTRNAVYDVYYNVSLAAGTSWQAVDTRVDTQPAGNSRGPCLRLAGSNVYVAWYDDANGLSDIHFNSSMDWGLTWQPMDVRLDSGDVPGAATSQSVDLACVGSTVYAVWEDFRNGAASDVYVNGSGDGGWTWGTPLRIEADFVPGLHGSSSPRIAAAANCLQVVWADRRHGQSDIYHRYSLDNGATWYPKDVRLEVGGWAGAAESASPRLAVSGAQVFAAWQDRRNGQNDIYFTCSADSGKTWRDGPDDGDIAMINSFDHGQTWSAPVRVNDDLTTRGQFMPWIEVKDNGIIDVVWYDRRNDPGDSYLEVYLGSSQDGGGLWVNSPVTDAPFGPRGAGSGAARWPWGWMGDYIGFDVSATCSYIAWTDTRSGVSDIYFDRFLDPFATAAPPRPGLPAALSLLPNWPNPCNPSTTIEFAVPVDARAHLAIYDVRGRRVRLLLDDLVGAGWHRRQWDGRDDAGRDVASGSYLCRLGMGDRVETMPLSLIR